LGRDAGDLGESACKVGVVDCFQVRERKVAGDTQGGGVLRVHDTATDFLRKKTYRGHEEVRLGEGKRFRPVRGCRVAWSHRISEFLPAAMTNSGE
jgi:hypothetical protein